MNVTENSRNIQHRRGRDPDVLKLGCEFNLIEVVSPNGELGVFVCADGTDRPYRLHLRSPSLLNFQVAGGLVTDLSMAQARQALCSLNVVPSEMDR